MMFGYGSDWAFWQVALMWVGMIAFWGLVIWAVYALVARASTAPGADHAHAHSGGSGSGSEARHILDQRVAKGEIDAEEYRRVLDLITHDDGTAVGTGGGR